MTIIGTLPGRVEGWSVHEVWVELDEAENLKLMEKASEKGDKTFTPNGW